jgi:hypothetical protein
MTQLREQNTGSEYKGCQQSKGFCFHGSLERMLNFYGPDPGGPCFAITRTLSPGSHCPPWVWDEREPVWDEALPTGDESGASE